MGTVMAFSVGGFAVSGDVVVLGAITGMVYGLLGVGLVLVYRSSGIINFAHGQIGAFAAAILGIAVVSWGVPYWVAFAVALAIGALVGGAAEVVVARRLRDAPVLITVVATLALSQFLSMFSSIINSGATSGSTYPQPASLPTFTIGALLVTPAYTAMLVATPLLVAGLAIFLRRSRLGLAMRAAAANPDAARMAGIVSGRVSAMSWALAGATAAFTAVLVLPTRGFTNTQFLGPGLLLRALVCAVVARLVSLPWALASGIALGVLEQLLLSNYPSGGLVEAALFAIILVVLLLQRPVGGREEDKRSWARVMSWPPLPETYQQVFAIRNLGKMLAGAALFVALLLPLLITNATAVTLVVIAAFALVGLSVGIVTGLSGQLSLGQFALAGVGATACVVATRNGGNFILGFAAAGVAAAATSMVLGVPALRIRGLMLAVTSLGFALAAQVWLFNQSWMLGSGGLIPRDPAIGDTQLDTGRRYYFVALAVLVVGFCLARNVWRGGLGRRLRAVRDNEDAARAFTIPATVVKLQAFAIAGFLAGLGGAVYGVALDRLSSTAFQVDANINVAATAVIGGLGILAGPLLGTMYIIGVPNFIPLDQAGLAATSFGWLFLVLLRPGGIAQGLAKARDRLVDRLAMRSGLDPLAERSGATDATPKVATGLTEALPGPRLRASREGEPLLQARAVTKRFGGVTAVLDASITVTRGEVVGLIGPNGAGKTTMFEILSGFTRPDAGTVRFAGQDVTSTPPERRAALGLIRSFQDAALFPTLTVLDAVALSSERTTPTRLTPSLLGRAQPERQRLANALDIVTVMGLHRWRSMQIRGLSTGTRRIVELACLLALEPELLLLDEPTSGIAQRETEALGHLLSEIRRELDLTLVIIEHDIPLVMSLCDRVIAMESGTIIADGTPHTVRNDPKVIESYLGGDLQAIERSTLPLGVP